MLSALSLCNCASDAISVAIVNYNTCGHLRACLRSVKATCDVPVIVVDNSSTDESASIVRREFPNVTLHVMPRNVGYGGGANVAVSLCHTKYVLLLNSDTQIQNGTCDTLVRYLDEHPSVAIAGPRIVGMNGQVQPSTFHFPTPVHVLFQEIKLGVLFRQLPLFQNYSLPGGKYGRTVAVPWVLGAALAIRRDAFNAVHGFDESYFMYYEEVDLCYRLRQSGWQVDWVSDATVLHAGAASTVQHRTAMNIKLYESLLRFYEYHYSSSKQHTLRLILSYIVLRNLALERIRLARTHDAEARSRIIANVSMWKQVFALVRHKPIGANKGRKSKMLLSDTPQKN